MTQSRKTKAGVRIAMKRSSQSGVYLSEIPWKGKVSEKMRAEPERKKSLWLRELGVWVGETQESRSLGGREEAMLRDQGVHCGQTAKRNQLRKRILTGKNLASRNHWWLPRDGKGQAKGWLGEEMHKDAMLWHLTKRESDQEGHEIISSQCEKPTSRVVPRHIF